MKNFLKELGAICAGIGVIIGVILAAIFTFVCILLCFPGTWLLIIAIILMVKL